MVAEGNFIFIKRVRLLNDAQAAGVLGIVGCSNASKSTTDDASIIREAAWNSLSDSAKDEVVGDSLL